jgi:glutamyl-tRNA synthetase
MNHTKLGDELLNKILPRPEYDIAKIEAQYPARDLPKNAEVTRIAPSPTGFMHLGSLYTALISERLARQTGGVFYLRIEDTDKKREVKGARELIMSSLLRFNLEYDEGPTLTTELGLYGPYTQSHRQEIYQAYVRKLLDEGQAYPCFMTTEEQEQMAQQQTTAKVRPGCYGQWAVWRDKSAEEIAKALESGQPFVIRFRSSGDVAKKHLVKDLVKGQKELPQNDNDIVLLKSDGLPTYHLAHVVDDHLMHTTTVIRGDEWFPSYTLHIQLAEALGFEPFQYGHIAPIQKMDGTSRRKLSKRKDPEANAQYYLEHGYPTEAVLEYLLNLANSTFEAWRRANPNEPYTNFLLDVSRLPKNSGGLLDLDKLNDVSRDILATLPPGRLYEEALAWAQQYDAELADILAKNASYAINIFSIEHENRKDITVLSDLRQVYGYFFDEIFEKEEMSQEVKTALEAVSQEDRQAICKKFIATYEPNDSQEDWFDKIKKLGEELGFTPNTKDYRQNPSAFKGSVAEVAMVLRITLTGRTRTPNLHEVMHAMCAERIKQRLKD